MQNKINKLFEYYDTIFFEEKVQIDEYGKYGAHYKGLNFDLYLSYSILDIDFLSIDDYFEHTANIKYNEIDSLFQIFSNATLEQKLNVISSILTLIYISSYREQLKNEIIKKSVSYLARLGLEVKQEEHSITISSQLKLFSGAYCDVYSFNNEYYKKQLKDSFQSIIQWKKRFQYEFDNMTKLSNSPYILRVLNYDSNENSYLMEICENNLFDYLEQNLFLNDNDIIKIIEEIILGMIDSHKSGILHRDLHLGNILIKQGHIVLSDFGLSKDTMMVHSLKSSSTPKNSHYFMDPVGASDFNKLDIQSDIYSVGKIIEYITKDSSLQNNVAYVIDKAINRDRKKRYQNLSDLHNDFKKCLQQLSTEEKMNIISKNISEGIMTPDVHNFVVKLLDESALSDYIVSNKLYNFFEIISLFDSDIQIRLLSEINDTYAGATGYGGFSNYDIFASLSYRFIVNSNNQAAQKIAYSILDGCASYRYHASDLLKKIKMAYPNL